MHGFGLVHVANEGIARIGRWQDGHYMHETPVPRRVLPRADFLGPDGRCAGDCGRGTRVCIEGHTPTRKTKETRF